MARLIQASKRAILSHLSLSSTKTLITQIQQSTLVLNHNKTRNYITEMRKSTFEANILRILRNEIEYESEYAPALQPPSKFNSFTVEDQPGEQWVRLIGKHGEKEKIKIEATMFDGLAPVPKPEGEDNNAPLHISLIVDVTKEEDGNRLEFICSAWPECLDIEKVYMFKSDRNLIHPYTGPPFVKLDEELQIAFFEFLQERGVNDELAVFLHEYMMNKDRMEFLKWMNKTKSFVEK
ncbi:hypothetical protein GIB67_036903 [Kingdonia uniflora]|uniref:Mitochondrial glycoprotein n=1 Tax=Kingdonia uniflora TaxID=39325 RepID=A0A7J7NVK6_9MAGN|nr:hypothetical protein GIB67_036903 [Kingdonia uniflora]